MSIMLFFLQQGLGCYLYHFVPKNRAHTGADPVGGRSVIVDSQTHYLVLLQVMSAFGEKLAFFCDSHRGLLED